MKKILVFSLILTMIFPAYCFASPRRALPTEEEFLEEIMLILEDGKVQEEEIVTLYEKLNPDQVTTLGSECFVITTLLALWLVISTLNYLDFSGGPLEILLNLMVLSFELRYGFLSFFWMFYWLGGCICKKLNYFLPSVCLPFPLSVIISLLMQGGSLNLLIHTREIPD